MAIAFPGESAEYRAARDRLLEQEIDCAGRWRRWPPRAASFRLGGGPVFHRDGRTIRHFWGSELFWAEREPGEDPRHVGTLEPFWNLLDLTPQGRPTGWQEQMNYEGDA